MGSEEAKYCGRKRKFVTNFVSLFHRGRYHVRFQIEFKLCFMTQKLERCYSYSDSSQPPSSSFRSLSAASDYIRSSLIRAHWCHSYY
jgi:hypothetical protein